MKFSGFLFSLMMVMVASLTEEIADTTCTEISSSIAPPTDRDDDNTEMYDHKNKEHHEPYPLLHHNYYFKNYYNQNHYRSFPTFQQHHHTYVKHYPSYNSYKHEEPTYHKKIEDELSYDKKIEDEPTYDKKIEDAPTYQYHVYEKKPYSSRT